ncbi:Thiol:disulfide interchange protein DsbL [Escherichia coli]|nr:Thiol:disulfide interchange protein DsbL [Escherichia coli]
MSKLGSHHYLKPYCLPLAVSFTASAFTEGTDYMVLENYSECRQNAD